MIVLTKEEAALALGWSFDRDYPPLEMDEIVLQDRLRAVVAPEWTGNTPDSSQNAAQERLGADSGTEGRAAPRKGAEAHSDETGVRAERIVALKDFADELERCIEPDTGDPELMDMIDVINLVRERAKTLGLNDESL